MFNWELPDWPLFRYDRTEFEDVLLAFIEKAGQVSGMLKSFPEDARTDAIIDIMVSEAIKTSEIEGEFLSRQDVMSSIKNNLGLKHDSRSLKDRRAQNISALMTSVRETFEEDLSEEGLLSWHRKLMGDSKRIRVGEWRTHAEPMQIVSGPVGKEVIHFVAPPSEQISEEMGQFIKWFNETAPGKKNVIRQPIERAAIAHVYFESIHPFEDGNGRIGRAISEKALSQGLGRPVLLSLSKTIAADRQAYYDALKQAQRSMEITTWMKYFANTVLQAQTEAEERIQFTIRKTAFFDQNKSQFNERQNKAIQKMTETGPDGFEGGMNARKYVSITGASKATATRDLQDLVRKGILKPVGAGRSVRYELIFH